MDLNMPLLGFGAMRLPTIDNDDKKIDLPQVNKMVDLFLEQGFKYFDTAYVYHGGKSELALRDTLVKRHKRDSFYIADKMPVWSVRKYDDLTHIFEEQLKRLKVDYIDYYLLHSLDASRISSVENVGCFEFLQKMKKEGKIRFAGFSFHDNAALLDSILINHPEAEFVQLQINYLDMMAGTADSWYQVALKHNKPIIVMEPIKGGSLAVLNKNAESILQRANKDVSAASWAMRYAASLKGIFTVLSGMSNLNQVEDNIKTFKSFVRLSAQEENLLAEVVSEIGKASIIPCTACKYCLEYCPKEISIPNIFSYYNAVKRGAEKWNCKMLYDTILNGQKAEDCIECASCVEHCPQKINIPEELKKCSLEFK